MYEVVIGKVKGLIFTKDKVKKNSIIAPIIRFVVLALGFLVVKLAYPYLDQTRYGVWMTILSIFNMLIVVDLGISNGLRNKLTEAYANNDSVKAKEYVSTAYVLFGIFIFILMVISFFVVRLFDYSVIFNVDKTIGSELKFLMSIAIPLFLLSFYFSLLNAVMYAKHDSALYDFRAFIFNLLYIPTILLIKRFSYNSIFYLASSYLVATNLSYIFLSVYLFKKKYRDIIPSLKNVKFVYMKDLLNVGVTFLFVQLSSLILMSADNIVITQFLGPQYVSVYQIVNKPFLVVYILFTGVTAPLWSAFTHHYAQKDVDWISNTIKKMIQFLIPIAIFLFVIALALKLLIYLWIGRELDYSLTHVIFYCIYVIQLSWNVIFTSFCNGVGKLKSQLVLTIVGAVMNIPLSYVLTNYFSLGLSGVILSLIISNLLLSIVLPIITVRTLSAMRKENEKGANLVE